MNLEDLKKKFKDDLEQFKNRFSFLKKKTADENEAEEEFDQDATAEFQYEPVDLNDEEAEENSDSQKVFGLTLPKDKKRLAIQGLAVVAIVFLISDEVMKSDGPGDDALKNLPPAPPKKVRVVKEPKTAQKPPVIEEEIIQEKPEVVEQDVSRNEPAIADTVIGRPGQAPVIEEVKAADRPEEENNMADKMEVAAIPQTTEPEVRMGEEEAVNKEETLEVGGQDIVQQNSIDEFKTGLDFEKEKNEKNLNDRPTYQNVLSNIKVSENEEIINPDFDASGRGLVYNCQMGHWACVNKSNYIACAKIQKKSSFEGRKPSCVSRDVYYSQDHCSRGQLAKVNAQETPTECH